MVECREAIEIMPYICLDHKVWKISEIFYYIIYFALIQELKFIKIFVNLRRNSSH